MSGIERDEDFRFLHGLLKDRRLHLLLKVHERLRLFERRRTAPVQDHAQDLLCDLLEELQVSGGNKDVTELISVLTKPHVKALVSVLDSVSQKNYNPQLPAVPALMEEEEEEEEAVRIVSLIKNQEPLGVTLKRAGPSGAVVVARVLRGGGADRSGLVRPGDEVREVNGVPLDDLGPAEITSLLAESQGSVTFTVIPGNQVQLSSNENKGDPAIPCREAGLGFRKGDVLEVLSQQDDGWWQARRHADGDALAGLIPSRRLQERRVVLQRPLALFQPHRLHTHTVEEGADYGAITGIHMAGLRRSFRLSMRSKHGPPAMRGDELDSNTHTLGQNQNQNQNQNQTQNQNQNQTQTQAHTYLEVVPYLRGPQDPQRLVLLVGPSGVGMTELKRRLLISDPDLYRVAVPHTTRERRGQEREGEDYHFVSRQIFEEAILDGRLVEYGRYRGHYYGITLASVHQILEEGKVCLLDVQPQAVERLYGAELRPCVVFVKPPPLPQLRLTRRRAKLLSDQWDGAAARTFTEQDFEDMIASAVVMETRLGHLFETVVVNGDVAAAMNELRASLGGGAETAVRWIPAAWL